MAHQKKRGGFDKDDVLAPLFAPFVFWHNNAYGTSVAYEGIFSPHFQHVFNIPLDEAVRRFEEFYRTGFIATREPFSEAVHGIDVLHRRHHELYVISAGSTEHREERHGWLERKFTDRFAGHHLVGYHNAAVLKAAIAKELRLDYFVDDNSENCGHVAANGITTYMFTRPWNKTATPPGVTRIETWDELLDYTR